MTKIRQKAQNHSQSNKNMRGQEQELSKIFREITNMFYVPDRKLQSFLRTSKLLTSVISKDGTKTSDFCDFALLIVMCTVVKYLQVSESEISKYLI